MNNDIWINDLFIRKGNNLNDVEYIQGNTKYLPIDGISNSTYKLYKPITITLAGDVTGSMIFDGSSDQTINTTIANPPKATLKNGSVLYDANHDVSKQWHKALQFIVPEAYTEFWVFLLASTGFGTNTRCGILLVHTRNSGSNEKEVSDLTWILGESGIDTANYKLLVKNIDGGGTISELWVATPNGWEPFQYTVLKCNDRSLRTQEESEKLYQLTLYNANEEGITNLDSSYSWTDSTFAELGNTTTQGNTALTNANIAKGVTDKYNAMLNIIGNNQ